jgi:hypothetical protein
MVHVQSFISFADASQNTLSILVARDEFNPRDLNNYYPDAYVAANFALYATTQTTTAGTTTAASGGTTTIGGSTTTGPSTAAPTTTPYVPVSKFSVCANITYKGMLGELKDLKCASGTYGR